MPAISITLLLFLLLSLGNIVSEYSKENEMLLFQISTCDDVESKTINDASVNLFPMMEDRKSKIALNKHKTDSHRNVG